LNLDNIVLIGFMGSGKSTIGRRLAKEIDYFFLDTDNLIENFENMKISDIFKKYGEEYFRNKEKYCVSWLKNVKKSVISTGGGMPIFVPSIKEVGKIVYLKVDFDTIVSRLDKEEIKKRPLFKDIKKAKELFYTRDKIYSNLADLTINNNDINFTISKIKEMLWM